MSVEKAIIARSRPHVIGMRAIGMLNREAFKGSTPELSECPVDLEPSYTSPTDLKRTDPAARDLFVAQGPYHSSCLIRLHCLISSKHDLHWLRAERFLKELGAISNRVGFEILGNQNGISFGFLFHRDDQDLFRIAFEGEFQDCALTSPLQSDNWDQNIFFYDFYPSAPYHHLQTQPQELGPSPYEPFIQAIVQLEPASQGFAQVLFEPVRHNWHDNVEFLTDVEFLGKTIVDPYSPYRTQQLPSGELRNAARKVETKASDDKPFYSVALRVGIQTSEGQSDPWPLTAFVGLIRRDGQPFQFLTESNYQDHLGQKRMQEMFLNGLTYRPGFLLNSSELVGLIHVPSIKSLIEEGIPVERLETLAIPRDHEHLDSGVEIGVGWLRGERKPVCINHAMRRVGIHLIGKSGTGKTTTLEHMILQDITQGRGAAFLDPHGDSVKRLLHLIPEDRIESTIYIDFGDPDWVPYWNPLAHTARLSIGRKADDLVAAIKSVVKSNAWGDRLEHILRNGFYALLHLENATFYDLLTLFEQSQKKRGEQKERLKKRILASLDNEVARLFWQKHYDGYKRDDFAPPLHKLSKLLTSDETVSLMLTQPENQIDFHEIMNTDKILLLDLSNLGPDTRGILGCFLLAFLHNTALFRNKIAPEDRKPFSIYCDEAHKLTTDTLEDMIAESRKFGVNLTLAHQFLSQFKQSQRDALSSMGTTIVFNVDTADARYLVKDMQDKVEPKDIITLKRGEAIARINTDILKIETPTPTQIPTRSFKEQIVQRSREIYCGMSKDVRERIQKMHNRSLPAYILSDLATDLDELGKGKTLYYEEFE